MLPGQRVAWYSLIQWQPPTTFKETNHAQLPLRDKFRLSPQLWSTSLSKTMIRKSSCIKGTRGTILKRRTKKVPMLNEETKRGRRVITPQVDQNDKTRAVHPSLIQPHPTLLQRCRWWKNEWTLWWMLSEGECPTTSTIWSTEPICHSLRSSVHTPFRKVLYVAGRKLWWSQRPLRSLGNFQDPDAPSRVGKWDHVQGLPYYAKRSCKDLVQQVDA